MLEFIFHFKYNIIYKNGYPSYANKKPILVVEDSNKLSTYY
jgi:hypothetical protein